MTDIEVFNTVRHTPESVSILPEKLLKTILLFETSDMDLKSAVLGEILFRKLLYRNADYDIFNAYLKKRHPEVLDLYSQLKTWSEEEEFSTNILTTELMEAVFNNYKSRKSDFYGCRYLSECHGVIAIVNNSSEAIPVPFEISHSDSEKLSVRDKGGRLVSKWTDSLGNLKSISGMSHMDNYILTLRCDTGDFSELLTGQSLALPMLTALLKMNGRIDEYDPLDMMITGAYGRCGVEAVGDLERKYQLAVNMGMKLFVAPDCKLHKRGTDILSIPVGTSLDQYSRILTEELERRGAIKMTPGTAYRAVCRIKEDIHNGIFNFNDDERRLARLQLVFDKSPNERYSVNGSINSMLLMGSICNHKGEPETGRKHTSQAVNLSKNNKASIQTLVDAIANHIVSLTDLTLYDDAEKIGMDTLDLLKEKSDANPEEMNIAEMTLYGALGGQPLLGKALLNPDEAYYHGKSLEYLRTAYDFACKISHGHDGRREREMARDRVQIALWHALLEPQNTEQEFAVAHDELIKYPRNYACRSLAYLARARFLGAYRNYLLNKIIAPEFDKWSLPESETGVNSWPLWTSLKYRGTLSAASGNYDSALADFQMSIDKLKHSPSPLFRFFSGTIALQAGESFMNHDTGLSRKFLQDAQKTFNAFGDDWFTGNLNVKEWRKRTNGLLEGISPVKLPVPQISYQY